MNQSCVGPGAVVRKYTNCVLESTKYIHKSVPI
jgi:hypothetical protein